MRLEYANYPALEEAFARFAREARSSASERMLVICPSERVTARLRRLLALRYGAEANVRFASFNRLLKELDAETPSPQKKLLPNDELHDFIVRDMLSHPGLNRYAAGRGFVSALKSSLRDLADSLADPEVLKEHLASSSDPRIEADRAHLEWLLRAYEAYLRAVSCVPGYRSYSEFFASALAQADGSLYLSGFSQIVFYGFYDMTGRQLELFSHIASRYPVTVFAPYEKSPGFAFARKFFESNYMGAASDARELPAVPGALGETARALFSPGEAAACPNLRLAEAPGARGELFYAAKQILKLVEEEGYSFADIAVFARGAEAYKEDLFSVFAENCIPLDASVETGLNALPLGVFCLNLLSLAADNFSRETVLAVVTSPYFSRKNKWRHLINACLASRDYSQWTDLITPQTKYYDPAFLAWLEECKTRLERLDAPRAWEDLCRDASAYLTDNVDEAALDAREKELFRQIRACIEGFKRRSSVRARALAGEFTPDLIAALAETRVTRGANRPGGVTFADALNARGLTFKAVFILGLNEKAFPRVVPEDPVLKDYYRALLRDGLGYWLNLTRERLEEEKLLFYTMVCAAREKLFVTWRRTDEKGKAAVPSVYLAELARAAGKDVQADGAERVSGRVLERLEQAGGRYLTPKEMSVRVALSGGTDKDAPYRETGLLTPGLTRALAACGRLSAFGPLTPYDGKVESGAEIFARSDEKGFSPSALMTLAGCPMKYFFSKGLGLAEKDETLSRQELAPNLRGTAYHEILAAFYAGLLQDGSLKNLFADGLKDRLEKTADELYPPSAYKRFGIYPVIWDLILHDLKTALGEFVARDAAELGDFSPSVFETEFAGAYTPAPGASLRVKGIVDRVDLDETHKRYRVVDYKSGRKAGKDLAADVLKKLIFQPFLYLVLAAQAERLKGYASAGSCLMSIHKGYLRRDLSETDFETLKPKADAFFARLVKLVKDGEFFLCPSEDCQYCSYASVCRRDAFKTLLRARRCPAARELEERRAA